MYDPVYIDGPLKGQRYQTDSHRLAFHTTDREDPFVYRIREFQLNTESGRVRLWLAYCSEEPDAKSIAESILRPEVFDKVIIDERWMDR